MKITRYIIGALLFSAPANATISQLPILDGSGSSHQFDFFQDGSSNYFQGTGLLDSTGAPITSSNPLPMGMSVGGTNTTIPGTTHGQTVDTDTAGNLYTAMTSPIPAGTNIIGKFGIDQTTPGTTNGVQITNNNVPVNNAQVNGVTLSTGTGAVGTGTQRIAVGTDTATVAGSTPAAAGLVATGAAPPTGSHYISALGSGATGGLTRAPINCDNHVFKHITTATDTNAVTGVTSQAIYICGWRSRAAGTATWFLETSANTSGTCGTPTQINGVATEAANTGETVLSNFWSGLKSSASNGLCINSTGTGGVDVDIWYAQF